MAEQGKCDWLAYPLPSEKKPDVRGVVILSPSAEQSRFPRWKCCEAISGSVQVIVEHHQGWT
jgi:hypothetical protein